MKFPIKHLPTFRSGCGSAAVTVLEGGKEGGCSKPNILHHIIKVYHITAYLVNYIISNFINKNTSYLTYHVTLFLKF